MKRVLSLVLSLALLFSFVSLSFAAVTVGGNLRAWYETSSDDTKDGWEGSTSSFRFDRLALKFSSDLSAINGFSSEVQFRQVAKNAYSQDSTSKNISGGVDIRVDNAYYYQKGIFMEKGVLNAGYIALPYANGSFDGIYVGSFTNNIYPKNSVGVKYSTATDKHDFTFALANCTNEKNSNNYGPKAEGDNALDYSLRVGFVPMNGIKVGLGYTNDVTNNDANTTEYVVDSNGQFGPVGYFFEYLTVSPKDGDSGNATYFEGSYKFSDAVKVYAGRGIALTEDNRVVTNASVGMFKVDSDWTVIGLKYQLAPKTVLQGEYLTKDPISDESKTALGIRLRVDF